MSSMAVTTNSELRRTSAVVRNLERGIAPQEEIEALRKINPRLAEIAERQSAAARIAIAKAKGE